MNRVHGTFLLFIFRSLSGHRWDTWLENGTSEHPIPRIIIIYYSIYVLCMAGYLARRLDGVSVSLSLSFARQPLRPPTACIRVYCTVHLHIIRVWSSAAPIHATCVLPGKTSQFHVSPTKTPGPGVRVTVKKHISYTPPLQRCTWCRRLLLLLNRLKRREVRGTRFLRGR